MAVSHSPECLSWVWSVVSGVVVTVLRPLGWDAAGLPPDRNYPRLRLLLLVVDGRSFAEGAA